MTEVKGLGEGHLTATVWPTYAGAINILGEEPLSDPDYERGQMFWDLEDGVLYGRSKILVPKGIWTHIIYSYHPTRPQIVSIQKLNPRFVFYGPSEIELKRVTFEDVQPVKHPVPHD